jgi:hypothetical protein
MAFIMLSAYLGTRDKAAPHVNHSNDLSVDVSNSCDGVGCHCEAAASGLTLGRLFPVSTPTKHPF